MLLCGLGVTRPKPKRFAKACDRFVVPAPVAEDVPEIVVSVGEVRPQPDRLTIAGLGCVSTAETSQHNAEVVPRFGVSGPELYDLSQNSSQPRLAARAASRSGPSASAPRHSRRPAQERSLAGGCKLLQAAEAPSKRPQGPLRQPAGNTLPGSGTDDEAPFREGF